MTGTVARGSGLVATTAAAPLPADLFLGRRRTQIHVGIAASHPPT